MKKILNTIFIFMFFFIITGCDNKKNEIIFEDVTIEYDGKPHSIIPQNTTSEMELYYSDSEYNDYMPNEIAEFIDVGEYRITCSVSEKNKEIGEYQAILKIVPKQAFIIVEDVVKENDFFPPIKYTIEGVLAGDELGEELYYGGYSNINYYWENKNYNLTIVGGNIKTVGTLIDTIDLYSHTYDNDGVYGTNPGIAPFAFTNNNFFENKTITSISFVFYGYNKVWNNEIQETEINGDLMLPIYIINSDLSTKEQECTEENGTKYLIDVSSYLEGKEPGDIIIIEGLNIYVGIGQTLAFGGKNMGFNLGMTSNLDNNNFTNYLISRNIFDDKLQGMYTLLVKIDGVY